MPVSSFHVLAKWTKSKPIFVQTFNKIWQYFTWVFYNKNFCFLWNFVLFCLVHDQNLLLCMNIADICNQGILKGEVSLYHWPPVWLVWISLFLKIKTKIVCCHTADSKPVKQEVDGTVILPPLVFRAVTITQVIILLNFNLRD